MLGEIDREQKFQKGIKNIKEDLQTYKESLEILDEACESIKRYDKKPFDYKVKKNFRDLEYYDTYTGINEIYRVLNCKGFVVDGLVQAPVWIAAFAAEKQKNKKRIELIEHDLIHAKEKIEKINEIASQYYKELNSLSGSARSYLKEFIFNPFE